MKFVLKLKLKDDPQFVFHQHWEKVRLTIGSSAKNDVVLDGGEIKDFQAEIVYDGSKFILRYLDSDGGSKILEGAREEFFIANYQLEFMPISSSEQETELLPLTTSAGGTLSSRSSGRGDLWYYLDPQEVSKVNLKYLASYVILILLLLLFNSYIDAALDSEGVRDLLVNFLSLSLIISLFTAATSLVLKVVCSRFQYFTILHHHMKVIVLFNLLIVFTSPLLFNINSNWGMFLVSSMLTLSFLLFTFYGYARLLFPRVMKWKLAAFISLLYSVVLVGINVYDAYDYEDKSYSLGFEAFLPLRAYSESQYPLSSLSSSIEEQIFDVIEYRNKIIEKKEKYANKNERIYP
ncbi:MAG: FHA domain-containing protein [Oligoflexia bacterium]|nr:FHA domain-containing protein [Oligoflexia bacterium]